MPDTDRQYGFEPSNENNRYQDIAVVTENPEAVNNGHMIPDYRSHDFDTSPGPVETTPNNRHDAGSEGELSQEEFASDAIRLAQLVENAPMANALTGLARSFLVKHGLKTISHMQLEGAALFARCEASPKP